MNETKNLNVRMPEELLERLRELAKKERRSLNSQVVACLDKYLTDAGIPMRSTEDSSRTNATA